MADINNIALLTSGGDAPGMNAAIRSVVRTAIYKGLKVKGVLRGYEGLINNEFIDMDSRCVSNILGRGGTILKTARSLEFTKDKGQEKAVRNLKDHNIDGLVVIGGNGSLQGAIALEEKWDVTTVGIPGTIDNDLGGTDYTIGSHTSVDTVLSAVDKIRDTVTSMERIYVVEVMGREEPYIAIMAGLAGGAEEVLYPGIDMNIDIMAGNIDKAEKSGKRSWIIIVSEGFGKSHDIAAKIKDITGRSVRGITLGHIQRGGAPNAPDRVLASRLGAYAVTEMLKGVRGKMAGISSNSLRMVPYKTACFERQKDRELNNSLYSLTKLLAT
jgi:6-phosphofructokinase 1